MNPEEETKVEESTENNDSQNVEEVVEAEAETDLTVEDYKKLQQKNKELYERAKTAEALAKAAKSAPLKETNETPGLTREEAILIAKGVSEDVINEAAGIAKAKGITLSEAMKTPIIEAFISKIKADEKREKAQLSASGGTSKSHNIDLINAVGMTEEEHRKAIGM